MMKKRFTSADKAILRRLLRKPGFSLTCLILAIFLIVFSKYEDKEKNEFSGIAFITDGDTLKINKVTIRLRGMDAPEIKQICKKKGRDYACGKTAKEKLIQMTKGQIVYCQANKKDHYGRFIGDCSTGKIKLNASMVERGWAVAYGDFKLEEQLAKRSKIGLWQGYFENPRNWRIRQRNENRY